MKLEVTLTGIVAWLLFSFSAVKLAVLYTSNPRIAYYVTYNICGVLFLLYSYSYLRYRFNAIYWLAIFMVFNTGVHLVELVYKYFFLIYTPAFKVSIFITTSVINLMVLAVTYLLIRLLKPKNII